MKSLKLHSVSQRIIPAFMALAAGSTLCTSPSRAQDAMEPFLDAATTTTTPTALLQYATLTGSGTTMIASRVPTVNSTGGTSYYDVTVQFTVNSSGQLALASGYPKFVLSPNLITAGFKAGTYVGPATLLGGKAIIKVSGPGVTSGGATEWSLTTATGANLETYPCSATWYVGSLSSNPLYPRLKTAGITSTAYSYGSTGSASCSFPSYNWSPNNILGLSQNGNTITIVSFSYNGFDYATQRDVVTYTLQQ